MKRWLKRIALAGIVFQLAINCQAAFGPGPARDTVKRILILGNSITKHAPAPKIGWYGNWGTAASSRDKDFVHLLRAKLHQEHPGIQVDFENISSFETSYWKYNLSKLDSLKALGPDIVVLRIGENVKADSVEQHAFSRYYNDLVDYFMKGNDDVKVLSVSSFWKKDAVDSIMEQASRRNNCNYIRLSHLSEITTNMALGHFKHTGVARHPSDQGMQAIADLIWEKLSSLVD